MSIHVILVSQEPLANAIPVFFYKPKAVVAVCTDMVVKKELDKKLIASFGRHNINVKNEVNAPDAILSDVRAWASELLIRLKRDYPGEDIVLNLTGGNKIMSLGFWEAFREEKCRIIYTDTTHNRIEMLKEGIAPPVPPTPLENVLNVPTYLSIQGFEFISSSSDHEEWRKNTLSRKDLTQYLAQQASTLGSLFSSFNFMAHKEILTFRQIPHGNWVPALLKLVTHNLIRWEIRQKEFEFVDDSARYFLNGGWLEEYAYLQADGKFFDVKSNVKVQSQTNHVENEFDLVVCHQNKLAIVECKTGNLEGKYSENNNATDIAYKAETLRQAVGGRLAQTIIVTAQTPSEGLIERARNLSIKLLGPNELQKLQSYLKQALGESH